ncbi:type I-F CRISPR-associated endoribonuclease Cas6/Csy4 [Agaribacter flavus]|uniref:Type I-F CRISPR-associated endoribonuclease Cas6/Csy4 n=1 Tax=Agaribacter flavus TaxID=1902781 RepID=A0ABV7FUG0_9ALTE
MDYYQEIRLLPDAEANLGFLWHKVFQQVHIALVENKMGDNQSEVGISIPGYVLPTPNKRQFPLGDKLRVFANSEDALKQLDLIKWLSRLEDYAQIKTIKPVPKCSQYAVFKRKHFQGKKRIEAKTRQMAEFKSKETGESFDKWFEEYTKLAPSMDLTLPYINTKSVSGGSSNSTFPLFIEMKLVAKPQLGLFNCYGFCPKGVERETTVPWFE